MRLTFLLCVVLALIAQGPLAATAQSAVRDQSMVALKQINGLRAQYGQPKLHVDERLVKAAARLASDLARTGRFGHRGSDGKNVSGRVRAEGYRYCWVAENIGQGYSTVADVIDAWMNSPSHRRNLLNRKAAEFGLVSGPGGIWVKVLGRPGC